MRGLGPTEALLVLETGVVVSEDGGRQTILSSLRIDRYKGSKVSSLQELMHMKNSWFNWEFRYSWFNENGSFSVPSFNERYIPIPQYTGSRGNRLQEKKG